MKKTVSAVLVLILLSVFLPMTASAADTFTLHADVPDSWQDPCFYGWGGSLSMSWPGEAMTDEGDGWWSFEVPADATGLIVNGNAGSSQTNDITAFEAKEMWVVCNEDRTFTVSYEKPVPTFTLNAYVPETWSDPCFYGWGGSLSMTWPGEAMTDSGDGWYSYVVPADAEGLIVNGNGGSVQTPDIKGFEPTDMWVVVNADTTFTLYTEAPEPEQPESQPSDDSPVVSDSETPSGKTGSSFFSDNIWCFAGGAAIIAAAAAAGAVLGSRKGRKA